MYSEKEEKKPAEETVNLKETMTTDTNQPNPLKEFEDIEEVDPNAWMFGDMKVAVDEETAQKDILSWMNNKGFSIRKRKENASWIKKLVAAVQDGDLVVGNDFSLLQKLSTGSEFVFKNRVSTKMFENFCKSSKIKDSDGSGRLNACVACVTGMTLSEVQAIEGEDRDLMTAIALFFL